MGKAKSESIHFLVVLDPKPEKKRPGWRYSKFSWRKYLIGRKKKKGSSKVPRERTFRIEVLLTRDEINALKTDKPLDVKDVRTREWVLGLISEAVKKIQKAVRAKIGREKYEEGVILSKEDLNIEIRI